jgi:dipeptidyl aminopeptidase/acylaminoacyl peptidase
MASKHAEAIVAQWGTKDYEDVMKPRQEWLAEQKYVITNHIAICGGSYGGYMTNFALGNTRRVQMRRHGSLGGGTQVIRGFVRHRIL